MSDTSPDPARPAVAEHRFPCEQCGADLRFDPRQARLCCDHCGSSTAMEGGGPWQGAIAEQDFQRAVARRLPEQEMEETRVITCPDCGAQVTFDADVHAAECPFCATPVVTGTGLHRHVKPRALLPFALDERAAHDAMETWLGTLWFAPGGLKRYARKGRRMEGIYVPYWTFDADTQSRYKGERGTVYYENRTVTRDGKRRTVRVQKVRWRGVSGRVARWFDDVLVLASHSLPAAYTDALEPWDLAALEPYRPDYLAGFRGLGYAVPLEDGFEQARAQMDRVIARDVRFDIGGDRQRIGHIETTVGDVTFKHILLPVWLAAYKYRGQSYRFVVNGRTGRVQGARPYSVPKIALAVIAALIVAGALGYAFAVMEGS